MEDELSVPLDAKGLSSLRVVDLKQELDKRGLSKSGSKKDLVKRLKQQLDFEKLCEERKASGDSDSKIKLDAAIQQNEFVKQYLALQQKRMEEKRLVEEASRRLGTEQSKESCEKQVIITEAVIPETEDKSKYANKCNKIKLILRTKAGDKSSCEIAKDSAPAESFSPVSRKDRTDTITSHHQNVPLVFARKSKVESISVKISDPVTEPEGKPKIHRKDSKHRIRLEKRPKSPPVISETVTKSESDDENSSDSSEEKNWKESPIKSVNFIPRVQTEQGLKRSVGSYECSSEVKRHCIGSHHSKNVQSTQKSFTSPVLHKNIAKQVEPAKTDFGVDKGQIKKGHGISVLVFPNVTESKAEFEKPFNAFEEETSKECLKSLDNCTEHTASQKEDTQGGLTVIVHDAELSEATEIPVKKHQAGGSFSESIDLVDTPPNETLSTESPDESDEATESKIKESVEKILTSSVLLENISECEKSPEFDCGIFQGKTENVQNVEEDLHTTISKCKETSDIDCGIFQREIENCPEFSFSVSQSRSESKEGFKKESFGTDKTKKSPKSPVDPAEDAACEQEEKQGGGLNVIEQDVKLSKPTESPVSKHQVESSVSESIDPVDISLEETQSKESHGTSDDVIESKLTESVAKSRTSFVLIENMSKSEKTAEADCRTFQSKTENRPEISSSVYKNTSESKEDFEKHVIVFEVEKLKKSPKSPVDPPEEILSQQKDKQGGLNVIGHYIELSETPESPVSVHRVRGALSECIDPVVISLDEMQSKASPEKSDKFSDSKVSEGDVTVCGHADDPYKVSESRICEEISSAVESLKYISCYEQQSEDLSSAAAISIVCSESMVGSGNDAAVIQNDAIHVEHSPEMPRSPVENSEGVQNLTSERDFMAVDCATTLHSVACEGNEQLAVSPLTQSSNVELQICTSVESQTSLNTSVENKIPSLKTASPSKIEMDSISMADKKNPERDKPEWEDKQSSSNQWEDRQSSSNQFEDCQSSSSQWEDQQSSSDQWEDRQNSSNQWEDRQSSSNQWEDRQSSSNQWEDRQNSSNQEPQIAFTEVFGEHLTNIPLPTVSSVHDVEMSTPQNISESKEHLEKPIIVFEEKSPEKGHKSPAVQPSHAEHIKSQQGDAEGNLVVITHDIKLSEATERSVEGLLSESINTVNISDDHMQSGASLDKSTESKLAGNDVSVSDCATDSYTVSETNIRGEVSSSVDVSKDISCYELKSKSPTYAAEDDPSSKAAESPVGLESEIVEDKTVHVEISEHSPKTSKSPVESCIDMQSFTREEDLKPVDCAGHSDTCEGDNQMDAFPLIESSNLQPETQSSVESQSPFNLGNENKTPSFDTATSPDSDSDSISVGDNPENNDSETEVRQSTSTREDTRIQKPQSVAIEDLEKHQESISAEIEELRLPSSSVPMTKPVTVESQESFHDVLYISRKVSLSNRKPSRLLSEDETKQKKSKWSSFASKIPSQTISISTNSLKNWFPEFKITGELATAEEVAPEDHVPVTEDKPMQADTRPENNDGSKNASTSGMEVEEIEPQEPTFEEVSEQGPVSKMVFIQNLVRPFTLNQLKTLLRQSGNFVEELFWIDKIKSKCFVTYDTEEEAVKAKNALHNTRWPESNPKILSVEFSNNEELELHKKSSTHLPKPTKVYADKNKVKAYTVEEKQKEREHHRQPEHSAYECDRDKMVSKSPEGKSLQKGGNRSLETKDSKKQASDDASSKLLDDLFKKTKSTPSIYWLPLSEEEVQQKEAAKKMRKLEREKRMQLMKEQEESERRNRRSRSPRRSREKDKGKRTHSRSPDAKRR